MTLNQIKWIFYRLNVSSIKRVKLSTHARNSQQRWDKGKQMVGTKWGGDYPCSVGSICCQVQMYVVASGNSNFLH